MKYKDIVLPNYNHCILNTITSILKYYNVETSHNSLETLDDVLIKGKYRNIVFIILDGMGNELLNSISKNGFFNQNKSDVLTSVYPSTTTAALTTYYSGQVPYETGWIAWSQYFKEYGRAIDMFSHKESYLRETIKNPLMDVFKDIMNYKNVYAKIEEANSNVRAFGIGPKYSERRAKRDIVADNIDELISAISDICGISGENFILAYSDDPDGILHNYGTNSDEAKNYILDTEIKLKKLKDKLGNDTLLIISADHGHKNIEKAYTLLDYPDILECLIMPPTLESRVLTFWVKDDMREIFEERFNKYFEKDFWLMTKKEFLDERKLLGTGTKHHKIDDFIGNYVALSVSGSIIRLETFLAEGKPIKKSTHCGLTKEEMEVPLILFK